MHIIILVTPPIHYIVFLLHPISNKKIPSPKELVYPDELFYYPLFHAGSRDFRKNSQTSKKERNSVFLPNSLPNDVKKNV